MRQQNFQNSQSKDTIFPRERELRFKTESREPLFELKGPSTQSEENVNLSNRIHNGPLIGEHTNKSKEQQQQQVKELEHINQNMAAELQNLKAENDKLHGQMKNLNKIVKEQSDQLTRHPGNQNELKDLASKLERSEKENKKMKEEMLKADEKHRNSEEGYEARIHDLQNQISLLQRQIQARDEVILKQENENEGQQILIGKYEEELSTLRQEYEKSATSRVDKELASYQIEWDKEKLALQEQLENETVKNQDLMKDLEMQYEEIARLQEELLNFKKATSRTELTQQETAADLQLKSLMLMIEVDRLSNIVQMLSHDLEDMHRDNMILTATLEQMSPNAAIDLQVTKMNIGTIAHQ